MKIILWSLLVRAGKTSTLIGKAGIYYKAGLVQPENILMLAFGNKAARKWLSVSQNDCQKVAAS